MPENKVTLSVLVIDDKPKECEPLRAILSHDTSPLSIAKWDTTTEPDKAVSTLQEGDYDLVILDLNFGPEAESAGVGVLTKIREEPSIAHHPVVVFTGYPGEGHQEKMLPRGVDGFLVKARDNELGDAIKERLPAVIHVVQKALRMGHLRKDYCTPHGIRQRPGDEALKLLGASPVMQELFAQIVRIAADRTCPNVLILGKTGTGKSLVARTIHALGCRSDKKFRETVLNTFVETLLESELFGHVQGAFTGATKNRPGIFQEANGGTVFLDEIGELKRPIQVKLLHVLRERKVRPVGGSDNIDVDFQLITATNQDLEQLVQDGLFRADLYHRLQGVTLRIPSLQERFASRPEELEEMITLEMVPWEIAEDESKKRFVFSFTDEAMSLLRAHTWPGNYAELQTLLRELSLLSCSWVDHQMVEHRLLNPELFLAHTQKMDPLKHVYQIDKYREATEKFQDEYIKHWLNIHGGSVQKTAERIGVDAATIYRRLKSKGMPNSDEKKVET